MILEIYLCQISRSDVKTGRGGCFWTHIAKWYIYFFDDQNINICLCFIGILIILGVHLGGTLDLQFTSALDLQFTSALDMQGGGGVNVPLIIFFEFVFLCGTLVYCFEEHMPLPASRGG